MSLDLWEHAARHFEPPRRRWATPGDLAAHLNPKTVQTPALDLIDQRLVDLINTPNSRLIITMPPQEGKSTRVAKDFVAWTLSMHPDWRVVGASYGQSLANRNGLAVRRVVERNPELGIAIAHDNGAAANWSIEGHDDSGLFSVGIGGGVTGQKCDLLVIDDPIKSRLEADSKVYRDKVWDWWTDEASARFGAATSVVLILTRWHHDDLAGRLLAEPDSDWQVLNIPAQCEDPESDPLGRAEGEFMISARGRTREQWEQRKKTAGSRTWASLYQGHPTPDTGNLFPADGWARYDHPLWIERGDGARIVPEAGRDPDVELVQSWDFTFKDTKSADYVVGQVWLRRGVDAYLLDQVRRRMGFSESCQAMLDMTARWPQAVAKLVEDKANGPAILNALRTRVGGLIPVEPEGSKYARAAAVTPLVEARNVWLPDPVAVEGTAWVTDLTDEARDFPSAKNDDTVDALSQAVHRLLLVPLLTGDAPSTADLIDDDFQALDWAASY
ncbi:phage terminase large subunit [Segeticoccus rhizosphaerae]|uniref:phage terminase large subunit n=1 Tax=Segeticoccus rhizosphaerae TaxID=1104777 RepID=UPI001265686E|nr:phage terminase large subunit [Segeticoccus rhizosphaerae]